MTEERLDRAIRAAFERPLVTQHVPSIQSLLARRPVAAPPAWVSVAAAAAVIAAVALVQLRQHDRHGDTRQLMAELMDSTHWTAPSDRLLNPRAGERFLGVPDFGDMTYSFDEGETWL
jgi:hypothetical protein